MEKRFNLKGKTVVYIDWANVHGWEKTLKQSVNIQDLFEYLHAYPEIDDVRLYFGTDDNEKSKQFLINAEAIGYTVVTKPVKYILASQTDDAEKMYRRKCDFDMEVCIDVHQRLNNIDSFIFFTGDGDFDPLYRLLIEKHKQVIVVYTAGHLGREIWTITHGLFKIQLKHLASEILMHEIADKNRPPASPK